MSEKRRDNKGRILHTGESQRKDGRYSYRYTDNSGERHEIYSWCLVASDKQPAGKRALPPLREQISQLNKDLSDGINVAASKKTTINDMFDKYVKTKVNVKPITLQNYIKAYDIHIRNSLGKKDIASVKYSHIKSFYIGLMDEKGISADRINALNTILHPLFTMAVRDDLIRSAPTEGIMREIKSHNKTDKKSKQALTQSQQDKFINFCYTQPNLAFWAPMFVFMLGTGCRISEVSALVWDDCDFERGIIHIRRALNYNDLGDGYKFRISTPKTEKGERIIPMLDGVRKALTEVSRRQSRAGSENFTVDGITDFVFTSPNYRPILNNNMYRVVNNAIQEYNRIEGIYAEREEREPEYLPHITAHVFRHTFCSRLFEANIDIKVVQEIMGHSSAITTLDVYTHTTTEQKIKSFSKLTQSINDAI